MNDDPTQLQQSLDTSEATVASLEDAIKTRAEGSYRLRLYVSGSTPRSTQAISSIKAMCEEHLQGRYELEVVDLYQQPHLAREVQVIAAPTLVKEMPLPLKRVIGDMRDEEKVLLGLDIQAL
jgi:circadian clock protein KaiB